MIFKKIRIFRKSAQKRQRNAPAQSRFSREQITIHEAFNALSSNQSNTTVCVFKLINNQKEKCFYNALKKCFNCIHKKIF